MALSDACFEYAHDLANGADVTEATRQLVDWTNWYSSRPWDYGDLTTVIREAAEAVLKDPSNGPARLALLQLVRKTQEELDASPALREKGLQAAP